MIRPVTILFVLLCFLLIPVLKSRAVEPPQKEIRAVWLTSVYGLDWPSKPANSSAAIKAQQEELTDILNSLEDANFNLVFVQARMRGDVMFASDIEPFAKTFSGKYGVSPGYDPLRFVIDECHKRGMECHAWFVTFPVGTERSVREQGKLSVVKKHPKLVKRHKGEWYLDPGVPGTSDYILSLVKELVTGYDLDGIHFDYIRYPDQANTFPDKAEHTKYGKKQSLSNWRRDNINRLVTKIYDEVKALKPWVQVSSSPLGKYNRIEKVPNAGWTAYETVFQDPQKWLMEGKHDMVVPMMYYLHDNFFPFVDDWTQNCNGRLIVPGLGAYRIDSSEADWSLSDLTDQIDYSRYNGAAGCAYFRCRHVIGDMKGLYDELKNNYYQYPAQLPPLTWLSDRVPEAPREVRVERVGDALRLHWEKPENETEDLTYTLYYTVCDSIDFSSPRHILSTGYRDTEMFIPVASDDDQGYSFYVTSSSRYHIESEPSRETYYYLTEYPK